MPKILVVDDEEDILELAEELFEMANFSVVSKSSAVEALAFLEAGEKVDAIVSDLVMPDMNGIEFFKALKAKNLLVEPFVFVTGYASENPELEELVKQGVAKIYLKPMQIYEIAEFISKELNQ
jgi:CheY-like chemotaxis protein